VPNYFHVVVEEIVYVVGQRLSILAYS